jgi:hypothetical protein
MNATRSAFCAALAVLVSAPVHAQAPQLDRIEILEFGIYSVTRQQIEKSQTTAGGQLAVAKEYKLITPTEMVTARQGVSFGIKYVVIGKPNGSRVRSNWITRFPAGGLVNSNGRKFDRAEVAWEDTIGAPTYRTYAFDETWEMVPGVWTFELYFNGRKLGEKRFSVVMP